MFGGHSVNQTVNSQVGSLGIHHVLRSLKSSTRRRGCMLGSTNRSRSCAATSTASDGVTLLDCRRAGLKFGLASTHSFRVAHALTRVHLTDVTDPFARRLELEVPALAALLGHQPLRIAGRPSTRSTTLRFSVEARHHRWPSDGVGVEFKYVWATHSTTLSVDVQMKPQVVLTSLTPRSFGWWFDEWLDWFR